MAKRGKGGRPKTQGKRRRDGRLLEPLFVKGSERAEERKASFHGNGYDPCGRAYASGLLGEGQEAKDRLDAARGYVGLHRAVWGHRGYRSALNDGPRGCSDVPEPAEALERRKRLYERETFIEKREPASISFFRQLVDTAGAFADAGPSWLDRLVVVALENRTRQMTGRPQKLFHHADLAVLKLALQGLDALLLPIPATRTVVGDQRLAA